jgi:hypothetical protein
MPNCSWEIQTADKSNPRKMTAIKGTKTKKAKMHAIFSALELKQRITWIKHMLM